MSVGPQMLSSSSIATLTYADRMQLETDFAIASAQTEHLETVEQSETDESWFWLIFAFVVLKWTTG